MYMCSGKIVLCNLFIIFYCLRVILLEIGKFFIIVINKMYFISEIKEYKMIKEKFVFLNWKIFEKGLN